MMDETVARSNDEDRPSALALALVRATGAAFLVIGCAWLVLANVLGVVVVLVGQRLLIRPGDLRSPWVGAAVELLRQWRGG